MAEKQTIGIYWGPNDLYFTDSKSFFASIPLPKKEIAQTNNSVRPLSAQIQDLFSKYHIHKPSIALSIPTQDIIFRSFIIPWMQPNEVENVVKFEVSKYIPFPLEELTYSFHPVFFSKNDIKRYRIIFVAIRKEITEQHLSILKDAAINIQLIEPSASSLIRLLKFNNLIPENKPAAMVELTGLSGKIIVIHQLIPHFVREFKLSVGSPDNDTADLNVLYTRLMNEIRISLDYFGRQDNQIQINDLFLIGKNDTSTDFEKKLENDLDIHTKLIDPKTLLQNLPRQDEAYINAIGASLYSQIEMPATFDLKNSKSKSTQKTWAVQKKDINIKAIIMTAIICCSLLAGSLLNTLIAPKKLEKQLSDLKQQLGPYINMTKSGIEQNNNSIQEKLTQHKNIPIHIEFTKFLETISELLPKGTWLDKLDITYAKQRTSGTQNIENNSPTLNMSGFAYSEKSMEQFRLTSALLKNIKTAPEFNSVFTEINIVKTETRELNSFTVTFFTIRCE